MTSTPRRLLNRLKSRSTTVPPKDELIRATALEEGMRAFSDEELNRFRRSADRRRTAPEPHRPFDWRKFEAEEMHNDLQKLLGREPVKPKPPNMDEADRIAAEEEFKAAETEVQRRISAMSDPLLQEHLSRIKTNFTDDDDEQNG